MKEASGEASMTVITVVLIAIVLGVATFIINGVMTSTKTRTCCISAGGSYSGGKCTVQMDQDCLNGTQTNTQTQNR